MDNECKAWESNVDATYEGNPIGGCAPDNWGSCGFQRHFPWRILTADETTALSLDGFTRMDITLTGAPTATAFDPSDVGGSVEVATQSILGRHVQTVRPCCASQHRPGPDCWCPQAGSKLC